MQARSHIRDFTSLGYEWHLHSHWNAVIWIWEWWSNGMPSQVVFLCRYMSVWMCMMAFSIIYSCFLISGYLFNAVCVIQQSKCQYCLLDESQGKSFCRREVCMVQLSQQRKIPFIFADKIVFIIASENCSTQPFDKHYQIIESYDSYHNNHGHHVYSNICLIQFEVSFLSCA